MSVLATPVSTDIKDLSILDEEPAEDVIGVIATPIVSPSDLTTCSDQQTVRPKITSLYGNALAGKRRALYAVQNQSSVVEFQLLDTTGNPINLMLCNIVDGDEENIVVKIREAISYCATIYTVSGYVVTADEGIVQIILPTTVTKNPAVYLFEAAVLDGENISFSNQFYLWVDRGLFGTADHRNAGPPNLDEVRLSLRDSVPEENLLLDETEFDLVEICHTTIMTCRYWNEAQPDVGVRYNTMNYPARERWLEGICGHLLIIASHWFRRNHMQYQAGGIAIDDLNKFQMYEATGIKLVQDYKEWVKCKKVEINCYAAMTSTGSSYGGSYIPF